MYCSIKSGIMGLLLWIEYIYTLYTLYPFLENLCLIRRLVIIYIIHFILPATFLRFSTLPMTEENAIDDGWTMWKNGCEGEIITNNQYSCCVM